MSRKRQQITRTEFQELLRNLKVATPATVQISTSPKMNKKSRQTGDTNPFLDAVMKLSTYNVWLNFEYEKSVNRQRGKDGKETNFRAGQSWGEADGRVLRHHNDQWYCQMKLQNKIGSRFINMDTDAEIELNELAQYLPPLRKYNVAQDVQNEVIILRPKLSNINAISVLGCDYTIVG